jgi:hypothetical protein
MTSLKRYFLPQPTVPRIAPAPDDDAADDSTAAPPNQTTAAQKVTNPFCAPAPAPAAPASPAQT